MDEDLDSGESEASSEGEPTLAAGVAWPDPFDAGTETSSPTGDERPSAIETALSKGFAEKQASESNRDEIATTANLQEGNEMEKHELLHGSSSTPSPRRPMDSPAASGPSSGSLGGSRTGSGTRTDRVAMALSQAAAAAAASGNVSGPSAWHVVSHPEYLGCSGHRVLTTACMHPQCFLQRMGGMKGTGGRRLWHRDSSSSPSSDGGVRRRGRKRKGWWEPPPDAKKLRQQQDQAPDFASMSSTEMNDYVRWWRKMHALTWRSGNAGAPSSRGDAPPPGTQQGTPPVDWIQQSR